jgi:hypothetical protein
MFSIVRGRACALACVLACALLLAGCVSLPQSDALRAQPPTGLPERVALDVPFFGDRDNFCGPSSLAMILAHAGAATDVSRLADQVYVPGRGGSLQVEMLAAPRAHGLVGVVLPPRLDAVLQELAAGNPVLLLVDLGVRLAPAWHYMVATGYDLERGELRVHSAPHADQRMRFDRVEYLWRNSHFWSMVALSPTRVPATVDRSTHAAAVAAFERAGRRADAGRAWQAHLARWPDSVLGWFALGNLAHGDGRSGDAEHAFRAALALDPSFVPALNNLALMLADQDRHDEAVALAEQALAAGGPHAAAAGATLAALRGRAGASPGPDKGAG